MVKLSSKVIFLFFCAVIGVGIIANCCWNRCCKKSVSDAAVIHAESAAENVSQEMTLTVSLAPLTICEALRKGTQEFKLNYDAYVPANDIQKKFIATQYVPYVQNNMFDRFSAQELKAYFSDDYKYLNEILTQNGFTIQLAPFEKPNVGIVALQDVVVKWMQEGQKAPIHADGKEYEGVSLYEHVSFYTKGENNNLVIAELRTKTDDKVYFVVQRDKPLFEDSVEESVVAQSVMDYHAALHNNTYAQSNHFDGVIFPMIMYNKQPSIEWILDLEIGSYVIAQALQEVIFKMNEKGAQAKAATALELKFTMAPGPYPVTETLIVDKPFLVWIERPGVSMPIFADYMLKQYWSNPGELPE
jgi:hypothetical protein